ncbi:MAG: YHS domain-containing protein [Acidobacteria bacterium]|nr:YHS domain-containing protein [Acidobacteriota bacterium]
MSLARHLAAASLLACILVFAGCERRRGGAMPADGDPAVRTIEQESDIPALPLPSDPSTSATSTATPALVDLPFTPAISMDPVDGGKVSIRPDTPVAEFKDRIYYFRSEENRQAFLRNPEKYVRGSLSRY